MAVKNRLIDLALIGVIDMSQAGVEGIEKKTEIHQAAMGQIIASHNIPIKGMQEFSR